MVDFTAQIIGNVTGFDTAPIDRLNASLKQVPTAANSATSGTTNFTGALGRVASGSNSAASPLTSLQNVTSRTGTTFNATGAIANNFGTTVAGTGAKTTAFTGSLNGMNTGLTGVQGGLTSTNTLHQNLATSTTTTTTKTQGLTAGLGLAATGFAGLTATGVQLFNMYDALGDATFNVQKATNALTKIQISEQSTQERINKLVRDGKTGNAEYGLQVQKLALLHEREAVANNNVANAQEDLNKVYADFIGNLIPTIIQGITSAVTIFTALRGAGEAAAIGEVAMGTAADVMATEEAGAAAATAGLDAELIALAAPAIAAAALFVLIETNTFGMGDAFRSITPQIGTAIDAIVNGATMLWNTIIHGIEVIAEWGANTVNTFVGVYNSVADFVNKVDASFQNLGVAIHNAIIQIPNFFINNLINPVISAWNSFTKGLQDAWNSTVKAIGDAFKPAAEAILGALKTIVDAGATIPGALGQPFKDAQKPINDAIESLKNIGTTSTATGQQAQTAFKPIPLMAQQQTQAWKEVATSGLAPVSNAYVDVTGVLRTLDGAMIKNAGSIKTNAGEFLNWASRGENLAGVVKTNVLPAFGKLINSITDSTKGIIGMIFPTDNATAATNKNATANKAAAAAVDANAAAQQKFIDQLNQTITKTNDEATATQQAVITHRFAAQAVADANKAYADSAAELQKVQTSLTDTNAVQLRFNTAVNKGNTEFLNWIRTTQDAAVQSKVFNEGLTTMTEGFFTANPLIEKTAENMKTVGEAMLGSADAAKKARDEIVKAFQPLADDMGKLVDDIAGKFEDLNKKVKKPFADLPDYIRKSMTPEMKDFVVSQAKFKVLGEQLSGAFGVALQTGGAQGALDFVQNVQDHLKGADMKGALDPIIADLQGAVANAGTPAGNTFVQKAIAELQKLGPKGQEMAQQLADKFGVGIDTGTKPVAGIVQKNIVDPFTGLPTTTQAVANKVAKAFTDLGDAFDALPGYLLGIFTQAFVDNILGPLAAGAAAIKGWIAGVKGLLDGFAVIMKTAFNRGVQDAAGSMNQLQSHWAQVIAAMKKQIDSFVSYANTKFAGIKPPTIATPVASAPTGPTPTPTSPVPVKIPPPDLTAFEAGLAKMQLDANNAFAAIVNIAKIQGSAIAVAFTQAFNTAAQNAAGSLNQLQTFTTGALGRIAGLAQTVAVTWTQQFNTAVQNAAGSMNQLQTFATGVLGRIAGLVQTVAVTWTQTFNQAVQNAAGSMNQLQTFATGALGRIAGLVTTVAVTWTSQFNVAVQNAAGSVNQLATQATAQLGIIAGLSQSVAITWTSQFNLAAQNAAGSINALAITVETDIANMIAALAAVPIAFTTNFNQGAQNAAGSINALAVNVETNIANMIAATNGFAIAITNNFNKGAQNAAGVMNSLAKNVEGNVANMIAATNAFAIAITRNFGQGAQNAAGSMNGLATNVTGNVNGMVSKLRQVTSEFNSIKSSIDSARSAVQSLISSINSIPTSKTVTVHIIQDITQRVHTVPAGLSTTAAATAARPTILPTPARTTALPVTLAPGTASKKITVEVKEPTIIKINDRELIRLINRKILELDVGAIA